MLLGLMTDYVPERLVFLIILAHLICLPRFICSYLFTSRLRLAIRSKQQIIVRLIRRASVAASPLFAHDCYSELKILIYKSVARLLILSQQSLVDHLQASLTDSRIAAAVS
jgi:hypothetical protein